jgi:hypothetical protein
MINLVFELAVKTKIIENQKNGSYIYDPENIKSVKQ